jgi:hypothetical protein
MVPGDKDRPGAAVSRNANLARFDVAGRCRTRIGHPLTGTPWDGREPEINQASLPGPDSGSTGELRSPAHASDFASIATFTGIRPVVNYSDQDRM